MKKSIKKLRLEKNTVSLLNKTGQELKGGAVFSHLTCTCPFTRYLGGCPLQTNEVDTQGYYIC